MRHPVRTGLLIAGSAFALLVILAVLGFALGWVNKAAQVAGPENVSSQYHYVIEDYNALEAAAGNYCAAKNSKPSANSPELVEDPAFAYAAQYRHITVDYDERQNNIFEAGVVGPSGYPRNAPTLDEMTRQVC